MFVHNLQSQQIWKMFQPLCKVRLWQKEKGKMILKAENHWSSWHRKDWLSLNCNPKKQILNWSQSFTRSTLNQSVSITRSSSTQKRQSIIFCLSTSLLTWLTMTPLEGQTIKQKCHLGKFNYHYDDQKQKCVSSLVRQRVCLLEFGKETATVNDQQQSQTHSHSVIS